MYETLIVILVFFVVLFFYIHIYHNYKTSDDLEVYELDRLSKEKLEEICNLKQPFTFHIDDCEQLQVNIQNLDSHYDTFDINICKNSTENDESNEDSSSSNESIPLPLNEALLLFDKDSTTSYLTCGNSDFLTETNLIKHIKYNDAILRPYLVTNCMYDVLSGSVNSFTPLQYEVNHRNYYIVSNSSVEIMLIPPKYSKYLYAQYDYETFEFKSPINVWNVQPKYKATYNKSKHITIKLNPSSVIYIPPYWWYSIRFSKKSCITSMKYRTFMNNISILPYIILHYLQLYNVKRYTIENKRIPSYEEISKPKTKNNTKE